MLVTSQGPIPLADAAAALIGSEVATHKRPQAQITVERRLYDIGSILSSVGLIEKTYLGKRCALSQHTCLCGQLPAFLQFAFPACVKFTLLQGRCCERAD